jgi:hypothetical protein
MSQCNFCGYTEPNPTDLQIGAPPRPVVPCDFCGSQICSGCRPNHEVGCRPNAQKKALGVGPTVSSVPYEHRAGHVVPETTPPDRRERVTAMLAVLGAPYELTPEPNEGPYIISRAEGQAGTDGYTEAEVVTEKPLKIQMAEAQQKADDATAEVVNSAPKPEVETADPATADGE